MTSHGGGTALISRSCISATVYGMCVRRHGKGNAIEYYKSHILNDYFFCNIPIRKLKFVGKMLE